MNVSSRIQPLLVIAMLLAPLPACALSGGPVEGQVLEAETTISIPHAIVVARWNGTYSAIAETRTVCYHVETATTDAEGRYRIPAWSAKSKGPFFSPEAMAITVYKPDYETYIPRGYARSEAYRKNIRYLKPFTGGREERLKYLERVFGSTGCGAQDESEKNLIPFFKALQDEVQNLAQTKEEKKLVESIRYALEKIELGYEQAQKRHLERVQGK